MLTRLEVDGFKSLRAVALDCEPFLAFVGANGAGKSNLFEALSLLSRLAEMPPRAALKAGRGHIRDQFSRTVDGAVEQMKLSVELLLPAKVQLFAGRTIDLAHTRVRYEVYLARIKESSGLEEIRVVHERFLPIQPASDAWIQKHPQYQKDACYSEERAFFALNSSEAIEFIESADGLPNPVLLGVVSDIAGASTELIQSRGVQFAVQRELRQWRFLQIDPFRLRQASESADEKVLARDGSNLPTVLAALPIVVRAQIQADFVRFVPGVASFGVASKDEELQVEVTLLDKQRLPARLLSDGTLRILALLTLLHSAPVGALFAIEELENGVYPAHLRALLDELIEVSAAEEGHQVLVSSHSPAVVAALHEQPESIVFVDLVTRSGLRTTRLRRISETSPDRGASTVSPKEVARYLETAQPEVL